MQDLYRRYWKPSRWKAAPSGGLSSPWTRPTPGLKDALMDGDRFKPGIAVAVNGQVSHLGPLQPLEEDNEVFFVPAIGGG